MNSNVKTPLSPEHISMLHEFCNKKGVRYYEVQLELVDHLANAIEERCSQVEQLTFENALQQVYKDFGVTGFRNLIINKEKLAIKAANKQFRKAIYAYFKLPHLLLSVLLVAGFAGIYVQYSSAPKLLSNILGFISSVLVLTQWYIIAKSFWMRKKAIKPMLMLQVLPVLLAFSITQYVLVQMSVNWILGWDEKSIHNVIQYVFIVLVMVYSVLSNLALHSFIKTNFSQAKKLYPQNFV